MFAYSSDNKRYHTLNYYFKNKFQKKVFKVNLNANFTCPNRDGSKATGGCIFCSDSGSGDFAVDKTTALLEQFNYIKNRQHQKWPDAYYVGYFQAYSNTYAPLITLKTYYELILAQAHVVGLHIATRPDCFTKAIYDYLSELNKRCDLWVELGLQSSKDETAKFLNRGHSFSEYEKCVKELRKRNIKVVCHVINGLVNETSDDMLQTIKDVVAIGIDGIKIHMLHIIKNTALAKLHEQYHFKLLTRDEFVEIVSLQLRYLPKEVVIFRIGGDASSAELVAPLWVNKKFVVLNEIDKLMVKENIYQGDLC